MAPKKGVMAKTRGKITKAAKRDARAVKTLAGEAVGAAATAAAGVVLHGIAKALGGREPKAQESGEKTASKRAASTKQQNTKTKSRGRAANKKASTSSR